MGNRLAAPQADRRPARAAPQADVQTSGPDTADTQQEDAGVPRYLGTPAVDRTVDASRAHAQRAAAPAPQSGDAMGAALDNSGRAAEALTDLDTPETATVDPAAVPESSASSDPPAGNDSRPRPATRPGERSGEAARSGGPSGGETTTRPEDATTPATEAASTTQPGDGVEGGDAAPEGGGAAGNGPEGSGAADGAGSGEAGGSSGGGAGGGGSAAGGASSSGAPSSDTASPDSGNAAAGASDTAAPGLSDLGLSDLVLVDTELAEHQRWGAAAEHVGAAGSADRAAFVVDQAGSGFLTGAGSGFGTGLAIGLGTRVASKAVPVLGPILGAGVALHGLVSGWGQTTEAVGKFGEGNDTYEVLANSIDAVSQIINVATGILNIINSIVSIVEIAAGVVAAGGTVAAVLTLGAAAPIVVAALEVVATCQEISEGLTLVTTVLDVVNQLILQPAVTLFRALHTFTSQADPRDVETQGQALSAAAAQSGGALGGLIGGKLAHAGSGNRPRPPREEEAPPPHPTPPATGEPPAVHFDEPPVGRQAPGAPPPVEAPAPAAPHVPDVDPHAPTIPAPAPVDPHAPTIPAPSPVDPHAPTIPAPAPVDPHAPTIPAPAPVDPHAPTIPAPAPVDPHAPTIPAPAPVDPHAPAIPAPGPEAPSRPAIPPPPPEPGTPMPEIPPPPRAPQIETPDYGPELPDWHPQPSPYAPTEAPPPPSSSRPGPTVDPHAPTVPAPADPHAPTVPAPAPVDPHAQTIPPPPPVDPHASTVPAPADPHAPTALPEGPGGMPEIPRPPKVPQIETPDYGPELPDWHPQPSPYAPTEAPPPGAPVTPSLDLPGAPSTPSLDLPGAPATPSRAPTEPAGTAPVGAAPIEPPGAAAPQGRPASRGIADDQSPAAAPQAPNASATPAAPAAPATPTPAAGNTPADTGGGMRTRTLGTPDGEIGRITDADIDAFLANMDRGGAQSDTFFELPGQNPRTGEGLTAMPEPRINPNPNQIAYNQNAYFEGVGPVRIANAADVPVGGPRGPGGSVIPAGVGVETPAPQTQVGGAAPAGNVEVRYHSANPGAPAGSYSAQEPTVQVNTPSDRFGWAGNRRTTVEGDTGRYLLPDGRWVTMRGATPGERADAHWPVGSSGPGGGTGPAGGPTGGGTPPPAGPGPHTPPAGTAPAGPAPVAPGSITPGSTTPGSTPPSSTTPAAPPAGPAPRGPRRIADDQTPAAPAQAEPARPYGPIDERSFADLQPEVDALNASPFGERLASESMAPMQDVPRDTARSKQEVHNAAYAEIPGDRPAGYGGWGVQDQHWTKVKDATINAPAGTSPATVDAINANRSPLQTYKAGEGTQLLNTQGVPDSALPGGNRGTRFYVGDEPMGRPAQPASETNAAIPAEPGAVGGRPRDADYNSEHRFADRYLIPEEAAKIQAARARAGLPPLDDVQLAMAAGEQARYRMEGVPSTDRAQNPVKPWSGEVVGPEKTPMQMLLAPEVLSPDLHAQGRTVDAPPAVRPVEAEPATTPVDPNQTAFDFAAPASSGAAPLAAAAPVPRPVEEARPAVAGQTRSNTPLTEAERQAAVADLLEMGVPRERIRFGDETTFDPDAAPGDGFVTVGPNVNPLPPEQRPQGLANPANAALGPRAVLGHEALGHRQAELAGQVRDNPYVEEAQASLRAALLDDRLPPDQRRALIEDAAARLRHQQNDDDIYLWMERYEPPEPRRAPRDDTPPAGAPRQVQSDAGVPRTPDQFRPQDQLPSVIVNLPEARPEPGPQTAARPPASEPAPQPAISRPATPQPAASQPASPQPASPQPASPQAASPQATTAQSAPASPAPAAATPASPRTAAEPRPRQPYRAPTPSVSLPPPGQSQPPGQAPGQAPGPAQGPGQDQSGAPAEGQGPTAPTWGTRLRQAGELFRPHVFGIGDAPAPKPEEIEARQRAQFTADNQPAKGVERVNPAYPPPPGTPAQVEAMQHEISRLLAARAQAEEEAAHQDNRAQQCTVNETPIQRTLDDTTHGISAAQAHRQSVAAHEAANQAQQQRQQESQSLVAGYPSRATGLAVLSVPLAAWQGFTSLASHLPGDAGAKMLQMNDDANKMQAAFADMGAQMLGIDGQQPARQAELTGDAGRLTATGTEAQGSQTDLQTAQAGAQGLQQANNAAKSEAESLRDQSTQRGQRFGEQAGQKKAEAQTLSEQMQAWAIQHRAARQAAITATQQRLLSEGKVNVKATTQ